MSLLAVAAVEARRVVVECRVGSRPIILPSTITSTSMSVDHVAGCVPVSQRLTTRASRAASRADAGDARDTWLRRAPVLREAVAWLETHDDALPRPARLSHT